MFDELKYQSKRIADPVHGTVGLSALELDLLSTRALQRLRNVKQLGLAYLVFPGADYSRLPHSIGVNHITGRILYALIRNTDQDICDSEYERYRLAGLLHDIGHYPFSHTFENAVSTFYQTQSQPDIFEPDSDVQGTDRQLGEYSETSQVIPSLDHEGIGQLLLETDQEISGVLEKYKIDADSIHSIFSRHPMDAGKPPRFANLISSDLDADRIDYLSRTARHTGLPYGSVDIDYLLNQMRLDDENRICLDPSALRTAEHFLLGRFFDYQQVNFHKTVAALEWALQDVVTEMLRLGKFDCSLSGIKNMIATDKWYDFDDLEIWRLARELEYETPSETIKAKVRAIVRRVPPKLIGSFASFLDQDHLNTYNFEVGFLRQLCDQLSADFDIPRDLWYVWSGRKMSLTKAGSYLPASTTLPDIEDRADAVAQMVRIKEGDSSKLITEVPRSLLNVLAKHALCPSRLYVLLPPGKESLRKEITERVYKKITTSGVLQNWISEE